MPEPLVIDGKIATDETGAREFLGNISATRFDTLRRQGIIRNIGRGWYSYSDLARAVEALARKKEPALTLEVAEPTPKPKGMRTPAEFLR